jgi:sigma-B regulation protein RsbU (phosphoserine phosphatase)
MSILPKRALSRGSLELAGFTTPAELVGGDYFDFIPVSDRILGLAIADASGHGLPAALQVRDVYTGLRMAVERDFKIVRTVERLNRIIHESRLTTRFVSLFYGEIEDDGSLMYVNAGHPHPLHFHGSSVTPLIQTGLVLGPTANATYTRGYRRFEPGDALLLYTDGMVEAHGKGGEEFGVGRLTRAFLELRDLPCDEMARELIKTVSGYAGGGEPEDDLTVVVLKRHAGPAPAPEERRTTGGTPVSPA